ncbi:IS5 family transposase [Lichenifustis flavocetrariae]|uniref:IS5 family transposase n=1 Tax=Lichenifustis flavocetrariae TaxID=2949735 RepID=A0AA41Z3T4_9HYPH|nr:IS5 family transposase [Lichenifustis flavocetrariae]MCW6509820.1 IS5 family transposase [Lichenifustis flavocetrariae]
MAPLLPPRPAHPLGCHRSRVTDRSAMDAIFFVLRTGCQWNALNDTGICSSSSAHRRFQEWGDAGVFEAFWQEGLLAYDAVKGIDWTWLSLDGAMVKAPLVGEKTGPNPTDRGKKGVKRSVLTDARGTPISMVIAGANRNDHLLMHDTLDGLAVARPKPTPRRKQHLCLDKGYDYAEPRRLAADFGFTLHLRTRGEEVQAKRHPKGKARRWVVEAAHSCTNRFRALLIRWNKKPQNYLALIHFACGIIAWRQCLPG